METLHPVIRRARLAMPFAVLFSLAPAADASAQVSLGAELTAPADDAPAIPAVTRRALEGERVSIEAESGTATWLYVTAALGLGQSAILGVTAAILVLTNSTSSLFGIGVLRPFEVIGAASGVVGGVGALAFAFAIGLHVDSHSRRDAQERGVCARISLRPTGVLVDGRF